MSIKTNTTSLQDLLERVNELPEAENLDTELDTQSTLISEQDAKIAELAEILSGKAGGGSASYDICTLQINNESGYPYKLAYTSVENGKIVAKYSSGLSASTSIICLCGSTFCCYKNGSLVSSSITQLGDIDGGVFNSEAYRINASANETIIATIYGRGSLN